MATLHSGPHHPGQGVYGISVAAELSGVLAPTLRLYEQHGLLFPARSNGGTRRYSDDDLDRVHRISELTDAGINLAGIAHILQLQHHNTELATDNAQLRAQKDSAQNDTTWEATRERRDSDDQ